MVYEIKASSEGMGRGVFATQDITCDTIIMVERPLLRSTSIGFLENYNALGAASMHTFHNLYCEPNPGQPPQRCIWDINCFHIPFSDEAAVFENACLINHSCTPNTECSWSPSSETLQVVALRDIKQEEEIFISYLSDEDLGEDVGDRRRYLENWGFICYCDRCIGEILCNTWLMVQQLEQEPVFPRYRY